MPTFTYEALDETGKPQKGSVNADTSDEAISSIRGQGFFPTSVREQKAKKGKKGSGSSKYGNKKKGVSEISINIGNVKTKHKVTFTRQLSTLQDAGLPILRSIDILAQQQKPGLLKDALTGVYDDIASGASLSDSMSKYPRAFDALYVKMVAAGEVGGVLDLILRRLAEFMEKAQKLKRRILGAMTYPACVITVAGLIVLGIMLFIVPQFKKIFADFDTKLPWITTTLISFSSWLGLDGKMIPGVVWVIASPFAFYFLLKLIRKTKFGKNVTDRIALLIPVAGKLIRKATIAKSTRTLGTLINAGVPILDAIRITSETTSNDVYARAYMAAHDSVRQGDSFAEPIRQARVCDAIVVNMIDVGEETGDLDKMLMKIADNYDEEVDVAVASLVSLLEPIMVVVLGGIVGFIVVALFLPLITLMNSLM